MADPTVSSSVLTDGVDVGKLFTRDELVSVEGSRMQGEREAQQEVPDLSLSELAHLLETLTSVCAGADEDFESAKASLLDALRQRARARGRAATVRDVLRRKL